jgi:hypothetical protein
VKRESGEVLTAVGPGQRGRWEICRLEWCKKSNGCDLCVLVPLVVVDEALLHTDRTMVEYGMVVV